jgi:ABC-2 type transport system permease protein
MTGASDATTLHRPRRKGRDRGQQPRQRVQYTELDPSVRAPRHGWMIVARKEFSDLVLSFRFLILVLILALAGAVAVYGVAGQLRNVAEAASGVSSLFLLLFAPPSSVRPANLPTFLQMISLLGPLIGIAFGFDAINGERSEGTLPRLLSQPIHRDDVINGKFVAGLSAIGIILAAVMLVMSGVGIWQLGIVPDPESILRLMGWWAIAVIYIGFWLAFALLCSVLLRRAAASALTALAFWLLLLVFFGFFVAILADFMAPTPTGASVAQQAANVTAGEQIARLSPSTLFNEATSALLNPATRTLSVVTATFDLDPSTGAAPTLLNLNQSLLLIWPQIVGLVALTVVVFAGAYIAFMRQEVRA